MLGARAQLDGVGGLAHDQRSHAGGVEQRAAVSEHGSCGAAVLRDHGDGGDFTRPQLGVSHQRRAVDRQHGGHGALAERRPAITHSSRTGSDGGSRSVSLRNAARSASSSGSPIAPLSSAIQVCHGSGSPSQSPKWRGSVSASATLLATAEGLDPSHRRGAGVGFGVLARRVHAGAAKRGVEGKP